MPTHDINHIWYDSEQPFELRVDALVSALTLREKIAQMLHNAPEIPRLGIPAYNWWNECLHGVARAGCATVFPQAIGMAATFNELLLRKVARVISDEARAKHHQALKQNNHRMSFGLTYWTPNINIFRDPRWGRGQETYGEDPYLTARLGVAFCQGLQGEDEHYLKLVATPKHYAVHSGPEPLRHEFDAVCSERDLRETYLPHFKACIQEGGAWSIMGAYNRTLGEPCCGSRRLLHDILREEWGFEGFVVSDCWAIGDFHLHHKITKTPAESAALAVKNGCDLNCGDMYPALKEAVEQGLITEEEIDVSVKRLFMARMKLGMFDPPESVPYSHLSVDVVHSPEHVKLARRMATESMVLLKNNGLLPLSKELNEIAVVGPNAQNDIALYANYNGWAPGTVTPFEGILQKLSVGSQVSYCKGCDISRDEPLNMHEINWSVTDETEVVVVVLGNTSELEGEEGGVALSDGGGDRTHLDLPGRQLELLKTVHAKGRPLVLVLLSGSAIDLAEVEPYADAILLGWYPGEQGGHAIADVLFGEANPAGRLPVTFVKSMDQLPDFCNYDMAGRTYRFMTEAPLYRFGYGLSYTKFSYDKLTLSSEQLTAEALENSPLILSVEVTNAGNCDGDEVVQLYVSDQKASVPVARHQLKGFLRISLKAGATQKVKFTLPREAFECFDDQGKPFIENGTFRLYAGGGQPDDPALPGCATLFEIL